MQHNPCNNMKFHLMKLSILYTTSALNVTVKLHRAVPQMTHWLKEKRSIVNELWIQTRTQCIIFLSFFSWCWIIIPQIIRTRSSGKGGTGTGNQIILATDCVFTYCVYSPSGGDMNFARRLTCNGSNCNVEKRPEFIRRGQEAPKGGPKQKMPGDWDWWGLVNEILRLSIYETLQIEKSCWNKCLW